MARNSLFREVACILLLCLFFLPLAGCMDLSFEYAQEIPGAALPTPDTNEMIAPIGDSRAAYSTRTTLYYRTANGQLSSALRLIQVEPEDEPLRLTVESLLETPYPSSGLLPIAPEGTRLIDLRFSSGIATVNLSAEAYSEGEEAFWLARAAIARTLLNYSYVQCVNVLVEGRAAEAGGMPLGALTQQDNNVAMGYTQLLTEKSLLQGGGGFIERNAVLYLPVAQDLPLLPISVNLRLSSADAIPGVIEAFAKSARSLYPQELLSQISGQTTLSAAGERVLTLRLPQALSAYAPQERLIPALMSTMCAIVPHVDYVCAYVGEEAVQTAGGMQASDSGMFSPDLFRSLTGSSAQLFFANADGTLVRTTHVLPGYNPSARALISALLNGPLFTDPEGAQAVFPESVGTEDILGVRVAEGVAHINLSSTLYSACQALNSTQERALVYAIVNTLVYNIDTVLRVQFYIDGAVADTFAGNIHIRTPLMANPGLIQ